MQWLAILLMAALLAMVPGYGSAQQSKEKPAAPSQSQEVKAAPGGAVTGFTPAQRRAYEKETATELAAIQQKIADLRVQANSGAPQMKRLLIQKANRLQAQKIAAGNQLTALEKASGTAWGQQKAELDKAMADLRKAFEANAPILK